MNMLGTNLVVLNSSEAIADLMDKRSAIYSDKVATCITFLRSGSDAIVIPTTAPISHAGIDGAEQVGDCSVRVWRKVEDPPPALPSILQSRDRGQI